MFARAAARRASRLPLQTRSVSTTSNDGLLTARRTLTASIAVVSGTLFAAYYFDSRSALHRYVITPTMRHTLDPETAHKLAVKVLRTGWGPRDRGTDDVRLETEVCQGQRIHCLREVLLGVLAVGREIVESSGFGSRV